MFSLTNITDAMGPNVPRRPISPMGPIGPKRPKCTDGGRAAASGRRAGVNTGTRIGTTIPLSRKRILN